jgi:pyrroloquinoline quinone biosynthesis protein D
MTEINETSVLSLAPTVTFQSLREGAVILMIDCGQLYTCNESTEAFLNSIDGKRNFGAILDLLMSEFATDRETLSQDFRSLVSDLQSNGILEIQSGLQ